jgi:hypothetical protein
MTTRQRLPNGRGHQVISFEFGGIQFTAGIGRYDNGRLAEVFVDCTKMGSAVEANAKAGAIILSIALQQARSRTPCQRTAVADPPPRSAQSLKCW